MIGTLRGVMMKNAATLKRQPPFPFVVDELSPIRPVVKHRFGMTYIYLDERLLLVLCDNGGCQQHNGVWLHTTAEHLESLGKEFPQLPPRCLWSSGDESCIFLASQLEDFEEYAFKACELILRGDPRIGSVQADKKSKKSNAVARGGSGKRRATERQLDRRRRRT